MLLFPNTDSCPLGDTTKQDVALNKNCTQLVSERPSMCYDDKVGKTWCCNSCGSISKPDPGMKDEELFMKSRYLFC